MPSFWTYITNGKYSVGCTEQTVYIYKNGDEAAKFKDLTYAYGAEISPDSKLVAVKTTDGRLAVYSLEEMKLLKKFRFSKFDAAQDGGFCFSADSKYFINSENHGDGFERCLSVYETADFTLVKRLFYGRDMYISQIEYDEKFDSYFVLGISYKKFRRNKYFAAELKDDELKNTTDIKEKEYRFYDKFKCLEKSGFTKKKYRWSYMDESLEELSSQERKISDLIKR